MHIRTSGMVNVRSGPNHIDRQDIKRKRGREMEIEIREREKIYTHMDV